MNSVALAQAMLHTYYSSRWLLAMPIPRTWRFTRRFALSCRYRGLADLADEGCPPCGKGEFSQLVSCLNVEHCSVLTPFSSKCYDIFIRTEHAAHARSFLLYQGRVYSNISLCDLWFAFDRLCPTVDWVVDVSVVD